MTEDLLNKTLEENTEKISEILTALANPVRLRILSKLLDGETEFSVLQKAVGLSKTALTHHLNNLGDAGIIENPKRGLYQLKEDGRNILASIVDTYTSSVWRRHQEELRRAEFITNAYERMHRAMELDVRIVELEPMRVASFRAISGTPEHDAAKLLTDWAQGKGYLNDLEKHPVFGFNNPNPSKGKREYGYEFWIKVDDDYSEEGLTLKDVGGGRYAVTTCYQLSQIGELWMRLFNWVKENGYECREAECLEKTHDFSASDDELVLDLYEPIK